MGGLSALTGMSGLSAISGGGASVPPAPAVTITGTTATDFTWSIPSLPASGLYRIDLYQPDGVTFVGFSPNPQTDTLTGGWIDGGSFTPLTPLTAYKARCQPVLDGGEPAGTPGPFTSFSTVAPPAPTVSGTIAIDGDGNPSVGATIEADTSGGLYRLRITVGGITVYDVVDGFAGLGGMFSVFDGSLTVGDVPIGSGEGGYAAHMYVTDWANQTADAPTDPLNFIVTDDSGIGIGPYTLTVG